MPGEEEVISDDQDLMGRRKSRLRQEIEEMLEQKGISVESRISITNLDTKEAFYFDDYASALQFIKGKKGRWYLATPGIRRVKGWHASNEMKVKPHSAFRA